MNISSLNNQSGVNPAQSNLLNHTGNTQSSIQGGKAPKVEQAVEGASIQDKRQAALQIVNRTLTAAYEKIASRGQTASAEYEKNEPLTAEKVAGNILGFIERRLQMDVAEGATQEELQARLEAGLSGFKKGFAEASEKLEALSLLSPEIKTDIGKTYDLVLEGVDELRKKFIESTTPAETATPSNNTKGQLNTATTSKPATKLEVPEFLPAATSSSIGYGNYEYGRAREFSFELTTKDGDKVTIKASSSEGFAAEAGRATRGNNSAGALNASYSSSQSFSLNIEGDLSEEELGAINDLLGRVNDLAGQFFNGNLDTAFEQALNLGYDDEQIGSFSLNLAQAEIQQVTQAYQNVAPGRSNESSGQNLLSDQLLPLGNFIKDLLDSLDRASIFDEPKLLVGELGEKVTGTGEIEEQQGKRFRNFMDKIFDLELR
ncbi:MAG: hypothetical protein B0W54_04525 [Cellvibrio sp. 79]|nr:MAG: hypothetical protein B0W54_04525 [Cellvibrio sp. 79]